MEMHTSENIKNSTKKHRISGIGVICWIVAPLTMIVLLLLDGCGLYCFNVQRLLVIGACLLVALFPFFSEITISNFTVKKDKDADK